MDENKKNNISFIQFMTCQQVRKFIWLSVIGIVIILIGVFIIESNKVSVVVNFLGAVLVFTSTEEIIKKMPRD